MRKHRWLKKSKLILGLCIVSLTALVGCGKKNDKIVEGMDKLSELAFQDALTLFEQAIVEGEDFELAYRGQGMTYLAMTEYEKATESFQNALSHAGIFVTDTEVDINYYMAVSQYKSGDFDGAIKTLDAITGFKEKQSDVFFMKGSIEMQQGNYEAAVSDLNISLANSKNNISRTIDIYQVFASNDREAEGRAYLSAAIEHRIDNMTDYEKGVIYYYMGEYENARDFLGLSKSSPKGSDVDTLLMLGRTHEQLGDSNYAAGLYSNYLAEHTPNAVIYNQLGLCKLKNGDYAEALNAFQAGLETPDNSSVLKQLRFNEIVAYEYVSDFAKASELITVYLQNYPDDEQAKREYQFLQTR